MERQKHYSPFLRGWIAITVMVVALFAMAAPTLAQTGQATTTGSVNMRNGPGTSYAVITVVPRGGAVSVDNCLTSGWCAVVYGNRAGFISRNYLAFGGTVPPVVQPPTQQPPPVVTNPGAGVQAQTTVQLNMRSGPGTQYGTVRAIPAGGVVTLIQCTAGYSWCEGTYQGSRGWMSGQYLRSTNPQYATQPVTNVGPQLGLQLFNFIAGQLGLNVTINTPPRGPNAGEVCLYTDPNFAGQVTCARMGQSDANLVAPFNDSISSIRVGSGAFVEICQNANFGGICRAYNSDVAQLPGLVNDRASSFRTTVAAPGPGIPGPGPGPQPVGGQACFYSEFNFTGQYFCLERNQSLSYVGNNWNDLISSIRVDQGVTVQVCGEADFAGFCEQYTTSQAFLPPGRDNAVSSIRVR